jgi:AI-2 transport protein TqsA
MQNNRVLIPLLGILALVAVGFVLKAAQAVIIPLMIAWLLSYILAPVVNWLARHRIPTGPAVGVVLLLLLLLFYLTGLFVHTRAMGFISQYDYYAEQFTQIGTDIMTRFKLPEGYFEQINWTRTLGQRLLVFSGSFVTFVGNLVMVLIFLVFMLLGKPYVRGKIEHAFRPHDAQRIASVSDSISRQIGRYLSIKLVISAITGVLVWLLCVAVRIDFPVTWGVLAFLLNFIPTIGSIAASIPPVLLALIQFYPSFWPAIVAAVVLLLIQQVMGGFIEPKMMGENLNLSPVVILLSLVFWGWLWGIVGALLSVPIAAAIKIVCENIEPLKPISILMGSGKSYFKKA